MLRPDIRHSLYFDHIVLTIADIKRTTDFYAKILGEPDFKDEHSIMYNIGQTKLFFALPYGKLPANDKFNANRIGLEHFAIGILTLDDLKEIAKSLDRHSIKNSGIHVDKHSAKEKIWLDDPDGIRVELYIRAK